MIITTGSIYKMCNYLYFLKEMVLRVEESGDAGKTFSRANCSVFHTVRRHTSTISIGRESRTQTQFGLELNLSQSGCACSNGIFSR